MWRPSRSSSTASPIASSAATVRIAVCRLQTHQLADVVERSTVRQRQQLARFEDALRGSEANAARSLSCLLLRRCTCTSRLLRRGLRLHRRDVSAKSGTSPRTIREESRVIARSRGERLLRVAIPAVRRCRQICDTSPLPFGSSGKRKAIPPTSPVPEIRPMSVHSKKSVSDSNVAATATVSSTHVHEGVAVMKKPSKKPVATSHTRRLVGSRLVPARRLVHPRRRKCRP